MCVTLICGVVAVFLGQFIITVIGEITSILGIEVFVTKQEQEARRQRAKLKEEAAALKHKKKFGPPSLYSNGTRNTSFSEEQELKNKELPRKRVASSGQLSE